MSAVALAAGLHAIHPAAVEEAAAFECVGTGAVGAPPLNVPPNDGGEITNTACGVNSRAGATNTTAYGSAASAFTAGAIALGANTNVLGQNGIALGTGAVANFDNSIAIGPGVTTTRTNQILLGSTTNTYTLRGVTSNASLTAQGLVAGLITTDADGNLASDGGALQNTVDTSTANIATNTNAIAANTTAIGGLRADINRAFEEIDKNSQGIAIAMALAGLWLPDDKTFGLGGGFGFYDDHQAFAVQAALRVGANVMVNGGVGISFDDNKVGGRLSLNGAW